MRFELSECIAGANKADLLAVLVTQLRKMQRNSEALDAKAIEASFVR